MHGSGLGAQFLVSRAYDTDPASFGRQIGSVVVEDIASLGAGSFDTPIEIAMVSVAQDDAQLVVDALVESGVRSILSVGPLAARVPPDVQVHHVDLVVTLETMTYELNQHVGETETNETVQLGPSYS
jgi:redox-sensing transcriptional repressor